MNASLPVKIDEIESYYELLKSDFIEETLERSRTNKEIKEKSAKSVAHIKSNFGKMAENTKSLGASLEESSAVFKKLETVCRKNAELWSEISSGLRGVKTR